VPAQAPNRAPPTMQPYDAYRALSDEQAARAAVPASPASHRLLKLACGCACVVLLLLACYIALCLWLPPSPGLTLARDEPLASAEPAIGAEGELFVIAMADWGGIPVYPYVTPAQLAVRSAMARAMSASAAKSKLVLALGDNFYFTGVTSASDPRFKATFEDVYVTDQPELGAENMFRLVAGNHDYGATKEISSQIAYSNQSKAWHFPAEYYTFSEPVAPAKPGGLPLVAQFVMIDTVLLAGGADGILDPQAAHARSEAHWAWLRATLSASTADYLVVAGHYPVWSVGWHGPTPFLVQVRAYYILWYVMMPLLPLGAQSLRP